MPWFRRRRKEKKPRFDYAAIRIGNVYVLPPTEEDVREFKAKRRKEITRRGLLIGGAAAALGALTLPLWWWGGGNETSDEGAAWLAVLEGFDPAKADSREWDEFKKACLSVARNPRSSTEARRVCAVKMQFFYRDDEICEALWSLIETDPVLQNRELALRSLAASDRDRDIARLVKLYQSAAWARKKIDELVDGLGLAKLRKAVRGK